MGWSRRFVLVVLFAVAGCGQESTAQLIADLKAPEALTRLKAVRTLPQRKEDAAQVIPALIAALQDQDAEIRKGAAFGLGAFGVQGKDAIPALQTALHDREADVRKAAGIALSYIDPTRFPDASKARPARRK